MMAFGLVAVGLIVFLAVFRPRKAAAARKARAREEATKELRR